MEPLVFDTILPRGEGAYLDEVVSPAGPVSPLVIGDLLPVSDPRKSHAGLLAPAGFLSADAKDEDATARGRNVLLEALVGRITSITLGQN